MDNQIMNRISNCVVDDWWQRYYPQQVIYPQTLVAYAPPLPKSALDRFREGNDPALIASLKRELEAARRERDRQTGIVGEIEAAIAKLEGAK